jgi:PST family polysaccharide transporter
MTVWLVPHILWCIHGTNISFWDIINVVKRPVASVTVGAFVAFLVVLQVGPALSPLFRLVVGCGILFGIYALMLLYVMGQKAFYIDLIRGIGKRSAVDEEKLVLTT